jgi:hypothetical protein
VTGNRYGSRQRAHVPLDLAREPPVEHDVEPGAVVLEVRVEPGGEPVVVAGGVALVQPAFRTSGGLVVPERRRRRLDLVEGELHRGAGGMREYSHRVRPRKLAEAARPSAAMPPDRRKIFSRQAVRFGRCWSQADDDRPHSLGDRPARPATAARRAPSLCVPRLPGFGGAPRPRRAEPAGGRRRRGLRREPLGAPRRERPLPSRHLVGARTPLDGASRPLDDQRAHRGQLHALRGARAVGHLRLGAPRPHVGRRRGEHPVPRAVDRRAEVAQRGVLRRARVDRRPSRFPT